jgi:hypothetical protein
MLGVDGCLAFNLLSMFESLLYESAIALLLRKMVVSPQKLGRWEHRKVQQLFSLHLPQKPMM